METTGNGGKLEKIVVDDIFSGTKVAHIRFTNSNYSYFADIDTKNLPSEIKSGQKLLAKVAGEGNTLELYDFGKNLIYSAPKKDFSISCMTVTA
jgi:hypothetical protein